MVTNFTDRQAGNGGRLASAEHLGARWITVGEDHTSVILTSQPLPTQDAVIPNHPQHAMLVIAEPTTDLMTSSYQTSPSCTYVFDNLMRHKYHMRISRRPSTAYSAPTSYEGSGAATITDVAAIGRQKHGDVWLKLELEMHLFKALPKKGILTGHGLFLLVGSRETHYLQERSGFRPALRHPFAGITAQRLFHQPRRPHAISSTRVAISFRLPKIKIQDLMKCRSEAVLDVQYPS
ncbi:hypothetical protein BGZ60DRAFT_535677 [Tricladium varicosporioides]|nr:hypothetical protein BGZ60DRAFT_535677 [Hymenoscyphus varicosporioides]